MNNKELKDKLRKNNIQITKTRIQILTIINNTTKPLTATEIDDIAKKKGV